MLFMFPARMTNTGFGLRRLYWVATFRCNHHLERKLTEQGIYPAVDPLAQHQVQLAPENWLGKNTTKCYWCSTTIATLPWNCKDIIAILGMDEFIRLAKKLLFHCSSCRNSSVTKLPCSESFYRKYQAHTVPVSETIRRL